MDISVFSDKALMPDDEILASAIGTNIAIWDEITEYVKSQYPATICEWKYPGQKYGWSYRLKDKKRVIVYMLPREGSFMVALIFGEKGYKEVMGSDVNPEIQQMLCEAKAYAEGRGIRLEANSESVEDIKTLIGIKLRN
jgi:hypothetical protein